MKLKPFCLTTLLVCSMHGPFAIADSSMPSMPNASSSAQAPLTTDKEKISYSIGLDIGQNFTKQGIELDTQMFIQGLEDGRQNKNTRMSDEEVRNTLTALQTRLVQQQQDNMKKLGEVNLREGNAFLEKNKTVAGVKTLSSGLQYRVLQEGKGVSPSLKDKVKTHYKGTLINGTEFDNSYARGQPVEFPVESVIKGWTEALQLMKPGAKWQIFVPAHLAYGEQTVGNVIPPNSTLIFEIELLSVAKANGATKTDSKTTKKKTN